MIGRIWKIFDIIYLHGLNKPYLSIFISGKNPWFIIESGDAITQIASIFDGILIIIKFFQFIFGGKDINKYLINNNTWRSN